jgi:hypothetical protein
MATNIYDYEEKVFFDPRNPTTYFGWYITTSSSELKVAHFKRPELRKQMAAEVQTLLPLTEDAELLAACSLIMSLGGEHDPDFASDMALNQAGDIGDEAWESLRAIGDKYATNYE